MKTKNMGAGSNIDTRYLTPEEYQLWDQFVDVCVDGTIFHKSTWLKPISALQNLNFSIAACFKGGELIGGMAFSWKKKFGLFPVIQIPARTFYFGPVIARSETQYQSKSESHHQSVVLALTKFLMFDYQMFRASFPPSVSDIRPYSWNGFQTSIHYTYRTDLIPEKDFLKSFDHSVRKQINKGKKLESAFHTENAVRDIRAAIELEQKSFRRQSFSMSPVSGTAFNDFVASLIENKLAQIYTISLNDTPVASRIVIQDRPKGIVYDWMAGADKNYLSTGLNQLLMYRVLEELQQSEFNYFDFGGAGTASIARYKSTFNFKLIPMYAVAKERGIAQIGEHLKYIRK